MDCIYYLKQVKDKLKNNYYYNYEELENDINNVMENIFSDFKYLEEKDFDFTDLYNLHSFLLKEVVEIHKLEESEVNLKAIDNNLNLDYIDDIEDKRRAKNIYFYTNKNSEYYLLGDIHSDYISLENIVTKTFLYKKVINKEDVSLIFIGDYVDRGTAHLKAAQFILILKYLFPQNIFLQRGNHDGGLVENGNVKLWVRQAKESPNKDWFLLYLEDITKVNDTLPKDIIYSYLQFFDSLSYIGFLILDNKKYMINHGGIPRYRKTDSEYYSYISKLRDLTDENIVDHLNKTILQNIIWSDPVNDDVEDLNENNGRFKFKEYHFKEYRNKIGFDILIRGHEVKTQGYEEKYSKRLVTVFSSGSIYKDGVNINVETAYKNVLPKMILIENNKDIEYIDLSQR